MTPKSLSITLCMIMVLGAVLLQRPLQTHAQAVPDGGSFLALTVPGYGPGVAGHVILGTHQGPFAKARVQILDNHPGAVPGTVVASTVTTTEGTFLVSVPPGTYVVHVDTAAGYSCRDAKVMVAQRVFSLVAIPCFPF